MTAKEFARIRKELGYTQKQLATLLSVSLRAIHSYEQGWRNVSPLIEKNLLFLLMFHRNKSPNPIDCWQVRHCSDKMKQKCVACKFNARGLCWYVTGNSWNGEVMLNWYRKISKCRQCEFFKQLFAKMT